MKRILVIVFLLLMGKAQGQFTPLTSQYMFNALVINPAYAGSLDAFTISASHRTQWEGMEGAPMTDNLTVHGPLKNKKVNVGLMFFRDEIGVTRQNGVFGHYTYRLKMGNSNLAFGISAGASFARSDWNQVETVTQNDPSFTQPSASYILPNASFGMYFHNQNFFAGVSLPFFLTHSQISGNGLQRVNNDPNNYDLHVLTGGYIYVGQNFVLKPSVLFKSKLDKYPQADFNIMTLLYNRFGFGASYRMNDAWVFPVQFHFNDQWMLAYSYDWGISGLSNYHMGSHEMFIRYCFLYKKNLTSTRSF